MSALLELQQVCKAFGGIVVADHIDLEIERGQILGLIGPNGAGKTSLFNLISGVFPMDSGDIAIDGASIRALPLYRRARAGVVRTWQNMRLFRTMTVLENLLVATRSYPGESALRVIFARDAVRGADEAAADRALGVLARIGLSALADSPAGDIPYGQQKLIGLARALMHDGEALLLDEPMAGVEGQAYQTITAIVREEAAAGRAVCVVEHNISFIKDLCTSAVFMSFGRILERGSVAGLLASPALRELYFGA